MLAVIVLPVPITVYQTPGDVMPVPQNGNSESIVAPSVVPGVIDGTASGPIAPAQRSLAGPGPRRGGSFGAGIGGKHSTQGGSSPSPRCTMTCWIGRSGTSVSSTMPAQRPGAPTSIVTLLPSPTQ